MNKAIFTGNLARDPETKMMQNGKPRCMFSLAVTRPYTNAQGQRDADFITVISYDKQAEVAQKYLTKGRKVLVETHVKTGSYEKDGRRVYTTEFVLDKLEFLSAAQHGGQADAPAQGDAQDSAQDSAQDYDGYSEAQDDELPF